MFTSKDLNARVKQRIFFPFRIVTSSGQTFDVTHPDLVLVGRREVIIGAASPDEPTVFDGISRVAIMHITALQDLPIPASSGGNGQPEPV